MGSKNLTKSFLAKYLSADLKEHFEVDNSLVKTLIFRHHEYGRIDLKNMSKKRAEQLVKSGCKIIKPKNKPEKKADK